MTTSENQERWVRKLTECQNQLYAYVLSLVGEPNHARDIVQETNVVLWRRMAEWHDDHDFATTACKVAYYQVLAFRRDRGRDRLVFDDGLVEKLAEAPALPLEQFSLRREALMICLGQLSVAQHALIKRRYHAGESAATIAESEGRSKGSVEVALSRIRQRLLDCIMRRVLGEQPA
jgi:RNA polymerase sigma-70 factor (ECF subfamily)